MQAMAPGKSGLPQAGQLAGVVDGTAPAAGRGPGAVAGGIWMLPSDTLPPEGGRIPPAAAPAPTATGCGAAAPTVTGFWHLGQRNVLPAELSGTCIAVLQLEQRITCGMVVLSGTMNDER